MKQTPMAKNVYEYYRTMRRDNEVDRICPGTIGRTKIGSHPKYYIMMYGRWYEREIPHFTLELLVPELERIIIVAKIRLPKRKTDPTTPESFEILWETPEEQYRITKRLRTQLWKWLFKSDRKTDELCKKYTNLWDLWERWYNEKADYDHHERTKRDYRITPTSKEYKKRIKK